MYILKNCRREYEATWGACVQMEIGPQAMTQMTQRRRLWRCNVGSSRAVIGVLWTINPFGDRRASKMSLLPWFIRKLFIEKYDVNMEMEHFRDGTYLIYYTECKALCMFRKQITWPNNIDCRREYAATWVNWRAASGRDKIQCLEAPVEM